MSQGFVFDVTAATFQSEVLERSLETPVLLDFWADWCGPCKTLGPVLEKLADEYGGAFLLGKVDTEQERELAAAFRVQGIPFVVLLAGGQPVDAFSGAVPEDQLRAFLSEHGIEPGGAAEAESEAAADPDAPATRLQRALAAARSGDAAAIRAAAEGVAEEAEEHATLARLVEGADWLDWQPDDPTAPAAAALVDARAQLLAGDPAAAMAGVLQSLEADRDHAGGLARRAMVLLFVLVGEDSDLADDYRMRMATLLY